MKKVYLNGISTYPFKAKEALLSYIEGKKLILIAINAEKILSNDNKLRRIINDNLGYPDGVAAVMCLKRKGIKAIKIPGSELWRDIINEYFQYKSFYLIGSTKEIIKLTVSKLKSEYRNINIKGYKDGYFKDNEIDEILYDIKEKSPDIIFVAMGSPKQEYIMATLRKNYQALYMGLGGSFDLYCGKAKPVPFWWKRIFKWEGLYRCFYDINNVNRWKRQIPVLRIIFRILFNTI